MGIKIGTAPVSWGIMEVKGYEGQKSYGDVLDEMAKAGYEGTELGPYGFLPTEPKRLTSELSARGLRLISAFVPIPLSEPERYNDSSQETMRVAELLVQSGAPLIILAGAIARRRRGKLTESQWENAATVLMRIARACKDLGLRTAFHPHADTFVETPYEIERLCALTDPDLVGLCFDTGHYAYGGGDPLDGILKYGSRIWHLHLKDVRPAVLESARSKRLGLLEAIRHGVFCELGEGAIDFPKVIQSLLACGYDGWAVVEQDVDAAQPGVRPFESALRSRTYLRNVLRI